MIDFDLYRANRMGEEFLQLLKVKFNKAYPTIRVYISTANPYNNWSQKLCNIYSKKEGQHG